MSVCKHCGRIGGFHSAWCPRPAPKPKTRVEITGNIVVHHPVKEHIYYRCGCNGCWACVGYSPNCTCDVDWDEVYGR